MRSLNQRPENGADQEKQLDLLALLKKRQPIIYRHIMAIIKEVLKTPA